MALQLNDVELMCMAVMRHTNRSRNTMYGTDRTATSSYINGTQEYQLIHQQRPRCSSSSSGDKRYRLGIGIATNAARRPEERGFSGGGSSTSMLKFTPRNSEELTKKPPATRGLRNRSFLPCPYRTHSSVTETMVTPEMGSGCLSPLFLPPQ